jgi:hypothetical protein
VTLTRTTTIRNETRARDLAALRELLDCTVLDNGDEAYAAAVLPWNVAVPMHPAAVVEVESAEDVATVVRFAGRRGLSVGVQATGHGAVSSLAGDILVSTWKLDEITVHDEGWARVGAGVKWSKVLGPAAEKGFAPLNGSSSDVGVVGYITGGGVGPMARTHGLASDTVRAFEVVTGDGELRRVTPTEHPDLFFGLRGGKGSLGIITAVEFDLLPMTHFFGGALYFDGIDAAEVTALWSRWSATLPERATTSFVLLQLPPLPFVPEPLAGKATIGVRFVWTGDPAEGEELLAPLREIAPVVLDAIGLHPYPAIDLVHADPVDPMPAVEAPLLLKAFPYAALEVLLANTGIGSGSPQVMTEIRQLGGAYSRPGAHPSAFDHRDAGFSLLMIGLPDIPGTIDHGQQVLKAMAPWAHDGMWPNFGPVHDRDSARAAYTAPTLARLRATAHAYDPAGVLTVGAAIRA